MARSTLYSFGRASRSGEIVTPTVVIPTDLGAGGVVRVTLDVLPNQRADTSRAIVYYLDWLNGETWAVWMQGGWRGNPQTGIMPSEEVPIDAGGGVTLRGKTARVRAVITGTVNFGGLVEWIDDVENNA